MRTSVLQAEGRNIFRVLKRAFRRQKKFTFVKILNGSNLFTHSINTFKLVFCASKGPEVGLQRGGRRSDSEGLPKPGR